MKRGLINMAAGIINQVLIVVIGLFVPRLFLLNFGSEINGLVMTVNDIFMYFALLEAGVGAASLQALYGTVGRRDNDATSGVFSAANRYYKKTGVYYFLGVILLSVGYPLLISSSIPKTTIALLVLMQGLVSVINYLVFAKFKILFQAEGKEYLILNLNVFVNVATSTAKIIFMSLGFNVIFVQSAALVFCIMQNLFVYIYIKKKYSWLDFNHKPNFDAIAHKNFALVQQISALVFNNIDVFILSIFCGFKVTSVYMLYSLFFSMVFDTILSFSNSFSYLLGQAFNVDKAGFKKMFSCFESYFYALIFTVYAVVFVFITPFLRLYTSGITDINYMVPYLPALFLVLYILSSVRVPGAFSINYAGHFKETMINSIIESVINLVVSIAAVKTCGIYGVLIGSIAALLYRSNDIIIYSNRVILGQSNALTYKKYIMGTAGLVVSTLIFSKIQMELNSYLSILIWAAVSFCVIGLFIFTIISVFDKNSFVYLKNIIFSRKVT